MLFLRKMFGAITQVLFPKHSGCGRCGVTCNCCQSHYTDYTPYHGCSPLCEHCWSRLTPEERLPYYRKLYDDEWAWNSLWIEKAVLEGK